MAIFMESKWYDLFMFVCWSIIFVQAMWGKPGTWRTIHRVLVTVMFALMVVAA